MLSFRATLLTTVSAPAITALGILIPTDSGWTEDSHGMPMVSHDIAAPNITVAGFGHLNIVPADA